MQKIDFYSNKTIELVIYTLLVHGPKYPRPEYQLFAVLDHNSSGEWEYFLADMDSMYQSDNIFISHRELINPYRDKPIPNEALPELTAQNIRHIENILEGYYHIYPGCFLKHKVIQDGYATEIFYHNQWLHLYEPINKPKDDYYIICCTQHFIGYLLTKC